MGTATVAVASKAILVLLLFCFCCHGQVLALTVLQRAPLTVTSRGGPLPLIRGYSRIIHNGNRRINQRGQLFPRERISVRHPSQYYQWPSQFQFQLSSVLDDGTVGSRSSSSSSDLEGNTSTETHNKNKMTDFLKQNKRNITIFAFSVMLLLAGILNRHELTTILSSKNINLRNAQQGLRELLNQFNNAGNTGLALYTILFCVWTMTVGITTPVETAAGFVFGAKRAIVVNACGKIGGALLAFCLGRFIFYDAVRQQFATNDTLQLVEESITEHPLLVAIMVRLSPLPEPVKNLGMSVLDIKSRYFVLSVFLHGLPFTLLWSSIGAETAQVVTFGKAPSATLKALVTGITWFGGVLSPALIAWWLKSLREKRAKRQAKTSSTDPA